MHHQSYRASPPSSEYGLRRTTAAQQSSLGYGQPFNGNVNGIGGNTMTSQPRVNGGVPGNMGNVNMQILAMQQQQNQLELELQMQQIRMQSLQLQEQIMQQQQAAQEQAYRNENAARRVMSIPTSSAYHPHSQHSLQLLQQQQQQDEADEALRAQQRRSALLNLRNRVASATSPGPTKTTFGDHQTALPKSTSAYFPRNLERSSTTSSASSGAASPTLSSPPAVILSKPGDSYPFVDSDGGSEDEREREREVEKVHRSMLSDGSEEAAKNFRRASAGAAVLGLRNKISSPPPPEVKTKSASIPIPNSASSGTLNAAAKPFSFPSKPLLSSSPKNSPSPKGSAAIELQQQGLGYGHPHSSAAAGGGQSAFSPAVHASLNGISHAHSQSNSSVGSRSSSRAGVAPGPGGNSRSKVEKITTIRQPRGPAQESEMASKNFSARIRKRAIGLLQGQGTNEDGSAVGGNSSVGGLGLPGGLGGLAAAAERRASRRLSAMTAVGA